MKRPGLESWVSEVPDESKDVTKPREKVSRAEGDNIDLHLTPAE